MANTMRWRYGDTRPVIHSIDATTVIEIGDLLFFNGTYVERASSQVDQASESGNQEVFHDNFAGVAMQASRDGDTQPIRVATAGVFEFGTLSTTYQVGELIGIDEAPSGTQLEDQVVAAVATANLAIGRCAKRVDSADTKVLVEVVSTVSHGGPQDIA